MSPSKETKRMRKHLARTLLKDAYKQVSAKSAADRVEIAGLKGAHAAWTSSPAADGYVARINELHMHRNQRALHLRHIHLARAFLKGVPYEVVEESPYFENTGWKLPSADYICDIINGQMALAETISSAEVQGWLNDNCAYADYVFAQEFFSMAALARQMASEEAARFHPSVAN